MPAGSHYGICSEPCDLLPHATAFLTQLSGESRLLPCPGPLLLAQERITLVLDGFVLVPLQKQSAGGCKHITSHPQVIGAALQHRSQRARQNILNTQLKQLTFRARLICLGRTGTKHILTHQGFKKGYANVTYST